MAIYQHHEVPGSPEPPIGVTLWHVIWGPLLEITPNTVVFDNPDGT